MTPIGTRNARVWVTATDRWAAVDREKAHRAAFGLLEVSRGVTIGDIEIKDLIDDGRP